MTISKEINQLIERRERIFTQTDEQIFKVCISIGVWLLRSSMPSHSTTFVCSMPKPMRWLATLIVSLPHSTMYVLEARLHYVPITPHHAECCSIALRKSVDTRGRHGACSARNSHTRRFGNTVACSCHAIRADPRCCLGGRREEERNGQEAR